MNDNYLQEMESLLKSIQAYELLLSATYQNYTEEINDLRAMRTIQLAMIQEVTDNWLVLPTSDTSLPLLKRKKRKRKVKKNRSLMVI